MINKFFPAMILFGLLLTNPLFEAAGLKSPLFNSEHPIVGSALFVFTAWGITWFLMAALHFLMRVFRAKDSAGAAVKKESIG